MSGQLGHPGAKEESEPALTYQSQIVGGEIPHPGAREESVPKLFAKIREVSFRRSKELMGSEIGSRWANGLDVPSYVGVNGGFAPRGKGTRLRELVASERWQATGFQVQFGGVCPTHPNWGEVADFLTAVGLDPYPT